MALAVCNLALSRPLGRESNLAVFLTHFDPALSGIIYMLMNPVFYIIGLLLEDQYMGFFSRFGGLTALALSIMLAFVFKNSKLTKAFYS